MERIRLLLDITKTHLLARFRQTFIAMMGVALGIGAFIILTGFMTGLNQLLDGLILDRTPHIHIYNEIRPNRHQPAELHPEFKHAFNVVQSIKPQSRQPRIHNALPLIKRLQKDPRVLAASPQVAANVFYLSGAVELNGVLTGIKVREEIDFYNFGEYIIDGSPLDLERNETGILMGSGVAKKMSAGVGDRVQVSTVKGAVYSLKIMGIYQSGLAELDDVQSFVNLKFAQRMLGESNHFISDINVKLHEVKEAASMSAQINRQYDLTAIDINTANAQFDTGSDIRNLITYAVSATLLLVAGFGIYNILNMLIYEKMDDIAILKATGFSGADVQRIFISQALIIGLVGSLVGLVMGFGISLLISYTPFEVDALPAVKTYPVNFDPMYYWAGIIFALMATFFAGYLPSRRAKYIDPVQIIRGK